MSGTADAARGPGGATSLTAQEALAAVLALIAGYVDAYTFLNYQVYGSFMSGNTTQTGLHAGQGGLAVAGYNLLPIPLFVAGVFAGTLIWHSALAQALALAFRAGRRPARAWARRRRSGSASRLVRHRRAEPCHGHHEHHGDPRGRATGKPWLRDRNLEQPCPAFGACGQGRASIPRRGPARHASAARRLARGDLDRLRHRRLARRRRDAKFCCLEPAVAIVILSVLAVIGRPFRA